MLKILHVTDLHSHKPFYKWVAEQSNQYDVICISGDLIGYTKHQIDDDTVFEQQQFVIQWLEAMIKPVFVCSGNHDVINSEESDLNFNLDDFDSGIDDTDNWEVNEEPVSAERCMWLNNFNNKNIYADNSIITIEGVTFGVVPYNYSGDMSQFKQCDILVHHEPPAKTNTAIQNGSDWGSEELYQALKTHVISPRFVLSGHVHHPNNKISTINRTTIYNPGADFSQNIPKHKVLLYDNIFG